MTREEFKEFVRTLPKEVCAAIVPVLEGDSMFYVCKNYVDKYFKEIPSEKMHEMEVVAPWFMRIFGIRTVHPTKFAEKMDAVTNFGTSVVKENNKLLSVVISNKDQCVQRSRASFQTSVLNMLRKNPVIVQVNDNIIYVC